MIDPSFAPDDALLRRFLLGELSGPEMDHVSAYLDRHPEVASTIDALKVSDTLLDALKRREPTDDPPTITALITRITELSSPLDDTADPAATAPPDASPEYAPTADPDGSDAGDDTEANALAVLAPSEWPGDLGRLGRYRVLRVLGRGGMGVVFEAEDDKLKRRVALKAMLPETAANPAARKRFVREAETAAKVTHDNIVPIYDIAEADGVPFLAMPLLIGETLEARLQPKAPLPVADALTIGRQIAEGLAAAHADGLIHRDIKPGNVWLEAAPGGAFKRARILDFGLARSVRDAGLTHSGAIMGTPAYMAPEQARGEKVDHRADLFSLGCVLYQMATGRRPFRGDNTLAVLTALATETPPAAGAVNPAVPPALSTLIELLLRKSASDRWPPSAQEVADELFRIATDPPSTSGARPGLAPPPVVATVSPVPAPRPEDVWTAVTAVADKTDADPDDEVPLATSAEPRRGPLRVFAACAALALVAFVGYLYGGTVIRVATDKGELVIEVDDPTIEVKVVRGEALLVDKSKDREFVLKAGDGKVIFFDPTTGVEAIAETFQLKRGGKTIVRATMAQVVAARPKPGPTDPRGPLPAADDRRTAETLHPHAWLTLRLTNGQVTRVAPTDELPAEPFVVTEIHFGDGTPLPVDFAATVLLPAVAGLRSLETIADTSPRMVLDGDTLKRLAGAPVAANLTTLWLVTLKLTTKNLDTLKRFPKLSGLCCLADETDDAVLLRLKELPGLKTLGLTHLGRPELVSDTGLAAVAALPLEELQLQNATIDPSFARRLVVNPTLTSLGLFRADLKGDAVLEFAKSPRLVTLDLQRTGVSDQGLEHLRSLATLRFVHLQKTKVTKAGLEKFAAARPDLHIGYDGGTIEPTATGTPVDLLARIDTKRDTVEGRWKLADGKLIGGGTTFVSLGTERLQVPYAPPAEYDLVMVVQRSGVVKGDRPFAIAPFALTLTGPCRCQVVFDYSLDDKFRSGLQLVDGKSLIANETRTDGDFLARDGSPVVLTCRVRKDGITVLTDGRVRFGWKGDVRKLEHDDALWKYPDKTRLALAVQYAEYTTSEWKVYPVRAGDALPPPTEAEQRKALEWVLANGGRVTLSEPSVVLTLGNKLPDGPLTVTSIEFLGPELTDDNVENLRGVALSGKSPLLLLPQARLSDTGFAKLASFPGLAGVANFSLGSAALTDAGAAHLKRFTALTHLQLGGTGVTDAGLKHLRDSKLQWLLLHRSKGITGTSLVHLRNMKSLRYLSLTDCPIATGNLVHLKGLQLEHLDLVNCAGATDAALGHIAELTSLRLLHLSAFGAPGALTDTGVARLATLTDLTELQLHGHAALTDSALDSLAACKSLRVLNVEATKVTKAGAEKLAEKLPLCRIEYPGGTIEPKK